MYLPKMKGGTNMEINYNVTGEKRKALIQAIGELLEVKPKYLGAPSFSYELGDISVDKQGTVLFKEDNSQEDVDKSGRFAGARFECVVPDSFVIELLEKASAIWQSRISSKLSKAKQS
jgi:hypothetical protein